MNVNASPAQTSAVAQRTDRTQESARTFLEQRLRDPAFRAALGGATSVRVYRVHVDLTAHERRVTERRLLLNLAVP